MTSSLDIPYTRGLHPLGAHTHAWLVPDGTWGWSNAGLVTGERHSRTIIYRADITAFQALTLFMIQDCCGGSPELCGPLIESLLPCCPPKPAAKAKPKKDKSRV